MIASIGSGLEKIIDDNLEVPTIKDVIYSSEIYIPFWVFFMFSNYYTFFEKEILYKINMVLPPCTDQGTSHYQGLVLPLKL